ncbi:hypothetical protein GY45DRAFT_1364034 [Cubamyces sp. BRFM 1775]|nr:hypothetical protein GY45DRAFT_1364034 [Cubamyces sp. BRFM 1775]
MAVIPRGSDAQSDGGPGQIGSPRVATSTVIGMVLGILCLFTMVLSYQFLSCSCKRRRSATTRRGPPTVSTGTRVPSITARSFTALCRLCRKMGEMLRHPQSNQCVAEKHSLDHPTRTTRRTTVRSLLLVCKNYSGNSSRNTAEQSPAQATSEPSIPTLRERRALRSLYLNTTRSPTKRYPRSSSPSPGSAKGSPLRKRMAGLFHDLRTPPPSPGFTTPPLSPHTPRSRRHYHKLTDSALYANWSNEEVYLTERPTSALISPWSPSEYEFPYPIQTLRSPGAMTSIDEPATPPPLYPPPPAYIPEIPLRSPGSAPTSPMRPEHTTRAAPPLAPPLSPIVQGLDREIQVASDLETWVHLRQCLRAAEREDDGVFVISDETEDDTDSGGPCTEESIQL